MLWTSAAWNYILALLQRNHLPALRRPDVRALSNRNTLAHWSHQPNQPLVEIAYICNPDDAAQTNRARAFFSGAFGTNAPPTWYISPAIPGPPAGCPTVKYTDLKTPPGKGIGTTLAHTFVWREFVRRHQQGYLVVFENDAVCAVDDCGVAIRKALQQAKGAFVYLGWCSMDANADPIITLTPPWCLHGYALTAHAARYGERVFAFGCTAMTHNICLLGSF